MEKKFNYIVQNILDKQFKIDFKGYNTIEVDSFLDGVINDYQAYDSMIKLLGNHLQEYENQVTALKSRIAELEHESNSNAGDFSANHSNVDILKRLTRLENVVFRR